MSLRRSSLPYSWLLPLSLCATACAGKVVGNIGVGPGSEPADAGERDGAATLEASTDRAESGVAAPTQEAGAANADAAASSADKKLQPMSLVSVRRPVATSAGDGSWLVNDTYFDLGFWDVAVASKPWAAIDLPRGLTRIFVQVYASQPDTIPKAYRLETSHDSTNGRDGTWAPALTVNDNEATSRAHAIDFQGRRWLRLVIDEAIAGAGGRVRLNELGVRDASAGTTDSWIFLGDSITATTMHPGPESFSGLVHDKHATYYPLMINAGIGGTTTMDALADLEQNMVAYPDVQNWAVSYGTNDSAGGDASYANAFGERLRTIITRLQAAGKSVFVPRIPFKNSSDVRPYNAVLDQIVASTGASRGPDLYAHFSAHKDELGDGVHPNGKGSDSMNRLWAEAVDALYR